ncbi:AAA family ATPase (plasmid) [Rhizobium leguminosarum bv. trifolii]|nr:AAA family ATPase [Rhizobium leguminosarum bv. trifolii]
MADTMRLSLTDRRHSLLPFEAEIPQFTLITGLNGSGKTQLLTAIQSGHATIGFGQGPVYADPAENTNVVLFNAAAFTPSVSSDRYERFNNVSIRDNIARSVEQRCAKVRKKWISWGETQGLTIDALRNLTRLVESRRILQQPHNIMPLNERPLQQIELEELLKNLRKEASPLGTIEPILVRGSNILRVAQDRLQLPYFLLTEPEVTLAALDPTPFFESSIGVLASRYRDRQIINRLQYLQLEDGETDEVPLSKAEFLARYGPPPWDLLNETLRSLGLDVEIVKPTGTDFSPYHPVMVMGDGTKISPDSLSSGERIILNLAMCGYQAKNVAENIVAPKVVLLDEVDSPLHPAMVKTYLEVIETVLIGRFGMHVIATTHSPSTVALFSGDNVYVMEKGVPGLQSQAKSQAIANLTDGVPTLSVALEDRRQVFAESPVEAGNLDKLYQILRPSLSSPLSLEFIATGSKHSNSSRDNVQRIVKSLADAGNKTTYGLIDWDLKNEPTDRIKVLAYDRRYALENIILDPLIVGLAIYRMKPDAVSHFGLDPHVGFLSLAKLETSLAQDVACRITTRVLGSAPVSTVECRYAGGLILQIDERYLRMNAHNLEKQVAQVFPIFSGLVAGGSGKLVNHLIEVIVKEIPQVIPCEVEDAFRALL